jgi:hypothetical protein
MATAQLVHALRRHCVNCASFPADLFLYSYVTDFVRRLLNKKRNLVRSFNSRSATVTKEIDTCIRTITQSL